MWRQRKRRACVLECPVRPEVCSIFDNAVYAFFDPYVPRYLLITPTRDDIPQLVSILRISTKYEATCLRKRAIDSLQIHYPVNVSAYKPSLEVETQNQDLIHHILVANVARETSAEKLLPAALLRCCSTANNPRELFDGVTDMHGTHHELFLPNKRAVFLGREKLGYYARTRIYIRHIQSPTARGCTVKHSPCGSVCRIWSVLYDSQKDRLLDPFFPFFSLHGEEMKTHCCETCRSGWQDGYQKEVGELWFDLPTIFDLPSWSVILADDSVDT